MLNVRWRGRSRVSRLELHERINISDDITLEVFLHSTIVFHVFMYVRL